MAKAKRPDPEGTGDGITTNSLYSIGKIGTDNPRDFERLQSALVYHIKELDGAKWPRGLQYFENHSYLCGNHLTRFFYNADGFGFHHFGLNDRSQFDNLVAKSSDNQLIQPVENVTAMLTKTRPHPRVEPNSNLPEDADAAAIAELLLDLVWERPLNMPAKLEAAAKLACTSSTVAIEVEYGDTDIPISVPETRTAFRRDPLAQGQTFRTSYDEGHDHAYIEGEGTTAPSDEDGHTHQIPTRGGRTRRDDTGHTHQLTSRVGVVEETGAETVGYKQDIQARVWSSFHINPDPGATCPDEMVWIMRSSFEDIDNIWDLFNKDEEGFFPENLEKMHAIHTSKNLLYWFSKVQDIIDSPQYYQHGAGLTSHRMGGGDAPNQVLFTVVDVKPTKEFPRGRTLIMAGDQLIYAGQARAWTEKYPWRWHPYAFFGWFKMPGRFWHIPLLTQLVPLQKKINAIDALVAANRQYMALGQYWNPSHAKVPDGYFSGFPGMSIPYTDVPGMRRPERVEHVPLPSELLVERDQLKQAIQIIAGTSLIGQQLSKSAARAGVIFDYLRNEKLEAKTPMLQEFERFLEAISQNILIEFQTNMTEENEDLTARLRAAAREFSDLSLQTFVGASLRDHHNVAIDIASAVLKSPEARAASAMEYLQFASNTQFLTHTEREALQRIMGLDDLVCEKENLSIKKAKRLISRIVSGQIKQLEEDTLQTLIMPDVDVPDAMALVFQEEMLSDRYLDYDQEMKNAIWGLFELYSQEAQRKAQEAKQAQLEFAAAMAQATGQAPEPQPA